MTDLFAEINSFSVSEKKTAEQAREGLLFLQQKEEQLLQLYQNTLDILKDYNPAERAFETVRSNYNETLSTNGIMALENHEEFDIPAFRSGFIAALENVNSFTFSLDGESLKIWNNLDSVAGTLTEYAGAVDKARAMMGGGKYSGPGVGEDYNEDYQAVADPTYWSSYFWMEKYYKPAREGEISPALDPAFLDDYINNYWETMQTRADNFSNLAPFWRIIEEGITGKMQGTGEPYPIRKGEHFVQKTVEELQQKYQSTLKGCKSYQKRIENETTKLETLYGSVQKKIKELERQELVEYSKPKMQQLINQRYSNADVVRLDKLAEDLALGKDLPARVELGYTPEGKRLRARTVRLQQQASLFRKGLL